MPRNNELISERNQRIRNRYEELMVKYPKWRHDAWLEQLSKEFFLMTSTIQKIINNETL